jgi:hypothetical protein
MFPDMGLGKGAEYASGAFYYCRMLQRGIPRPGIVLGLAAVKSIVAYGTLPGLEAAIAPQFYPRAPPQQNIRVEQQLGFILPGRFFIVPGFYLAVIEAVPQYHVQDVIPALQQGAGIVGTVINGSVVDGLGGTQEVVPNLGTVKVQFMIPEAAEKYRTGQGLCRQKKIPEEEGRGRFIDRGVADKMAALPAGKTFGRNMGIHFDLLHGLV